ncbi:Methyltransferase type 11 [Desulfovibrio sp. X2]|uniref:class I SAM-dependent methyltransferase n=1 Tax=Desulfovibrio sp. X2 TaxID=941449 RepID=UPI000358A84B|nr:class I SAM-dependent methyltransferase [Desulfovibrio sp. X2]EPR43931.1 Methyltransferase type 11 [Desulfovibrio sp. X2]
MVYDETAVRRYESWFRTPQGRVAFEREKALLASMLSPWPRRGQRLLEVGCGPGLFLENFWDMGFDVDGLDPSPAMLAASRRLLGRRAELRLGHAEHLPYDDKEYDFVALITSLEFCDDPAQALREAVRVACKGVVVAFLNKLSLYYLLHGMPWPSCRTGELRRVRWFTWREITRLLTEAAGRRPHASRSVLPGPPATWRESLPWTLVNRPAYPPCIGAFGAVRFDLTGERGMTPLMAFRTEPSASGGV